MATSDIDHVRLLTNDIGTTKVFTDTEIQSFLDLEGSVKRAAAQALDTIASNEALTSKAIRTQDLSTDGPKTAAALREHASRLRVQAEREEYLADEGFFEIVPINGTASSPELTEPATYWP